MFLRNSMHSSDARYVAISCIVTYSFRVAVDIALPFSWSHCQISCQFLLNRIASLMESLSNVMPSSNSIRGKRMHFAYMTWIASNADQPAALSAGGSITSQQQGLRRAPLPPSIVFCRQSDPLPCRARLGRAGKKGSFEPSGEERIPRTE